MKKVTVFVSYILLCLISQSVFGQQATIKVDTLREVGDIDPNLYGVFMEPIAGTMDGTLYDPSHPLANEDGFRTDYIEAAKDLQLTNMRWPGGNYTLTYDWKEGIGPKEDRPVRRELAWNVLDRNHVGTDEWLALSRHMGVENSICINTTTASLEDNRDWITYVNSPTGSYWSDLRAKYGHPEPYDVEYWHLGNEVDGDPWQAVSLTSEEYVTYAEDAASIMRFVNRDCESCTQPTFIAMGSSWVVHNGVSGDWEQWNWDVIDGLIDERNVHYIAIHRYWGDYLTEDIGPTREPRVFLGDWAKHLDDYISTVENQIEVAKIKHGVQDKPFNIAFTEWSAGEDSQLETLAGALHFNTFLRHADYVKRSNYTLFTSLLELNDDGESYKTPFYHMFKLFSTNARGQSLEPYVDSGTFDGKKYSDIKYLDVSTTYSSDQNELVINVVNRNMKEAISTDIRSSTAEFTGDAEVKVINNDDVDREYTYENRDEYMPATQEVSANGDSFQFSFPPHSFAQIKVSLE